MAIRAEHGTTDEGIVSTLRLLWANITSRARGPLHLTIYPSYTSSWVASSEIFCVTVIVNKIS
jgi:hypothetical protein